VTGGWILLFIPALSGVAGWQLHLCYTLSKVSVLLLQAAFACSMSSGGLLQHL
jgi:hypothetical protein